MRLLVLFLSIPLFAQQPYGLGGFDHDYPTTRGAESLFSTMDGRSTEAWVISSMNFIEFSFDTYAADDFVIPSDISAWRIDNVKVFGAYYVGTGDAQSVNVLFWAHDEQTGLPIGTTPEEAFYAFMDIPYVDLISGDFSIDLPNGGAVLGEGRWWITVQANHSIKLGEWGWTESSLEAETGLTHGLESVWYQDFNPGFTAGTKLCRGEWAPRTATCGLTNNENEQQDPNFPLEKDMAFSLDGEVLTYIDVAVPSALETDEYGLTSEFNVVLNNQPNADVVITLASSESSEILLTTTGQDSGDQLQLTFTPENWNTPQPVILVGQNDAVVDGDTSVEITFESTTSTDLAFDGLSLASVQAINREDECQLQIHTTGTTNPAFAKDGQSFAFLAPRSKNASQQGIYLRTDNGTQELDLPDNLNVTSFTMSDDAQQFAFIATALEIQDIWTYDHQTQESQNITTQSLASEMANVAISGDGSRILFVSTGNLTTENADGSAELYSILFNGTAMAMISANQSFANGNVTAFALNEDGSKGALLRSLEDQSLAVYMLDGDTPTKLDVQNLVDLAINDTGQYLALIAADDLTGNNNDTNREVFLYDAQAMENAYTQITQTTTQGLSEVYLSKTDLTLFFKTTENILNENDFQGENYFRQKDDVLIRLSQNSGQDQLGSLSFSGTTNRAAFTSSANEVFRIHEVYLPDLLDSLPLWPQTRNILELLSLSCD